MSQLFKHLLTGYPVVEIVIIAAIVHVQYLQYWD